MVISSSTWMRRVIHLTTVLALVLTIGLHWALLQSVAWVGMFVAYSQSNSFLTAATMTLDGKHPCPMCKAVKSGASEERKQSQKAPESSLKLELALPGIPLILPKSTAYGLPHHEESLPHSFLTEPSTPPPRLIQVV